MKYTQHAAINTITKALSKQRVYDTDGDEVVGFFFYKDGWKQLYKDSDGYLRYFALSNEGIEYLLDQVEPGARVDKDSLPGEWERGVMNIRQD